MPPFRTLLQLVLPARDAGPATVARRVRRPAPPQPSSPSTALLWLLAVAAAVAAQARAASQTVPTSQPPQVADTPLHVPTNRFEFIASPDTRPLSKPLDVHNGGAARLTDVRLTGLTYTDSARARGWLLALPRQSSVAPNELATIGTLCVDATGLPSGTYRATAAVSAREVAAPVGITVTLVVEPAGSPRTLPDSAHQDRDGSGTRVRPDDARCGTPVTKDSNR